MIAFEFAHKGFKSGNFLNFTPMVAYEKAVSGNVCILDVRERNLLGYKRFDVPNIFYIPLSELKEKMNELSMHQPYIVADSTGLRSHEAMELLLKAGFTTIANLAGGIVEWERDSMPLIINRKEQLDGSCMCQLRPRNKHNN